MNRLNTPSVQKRLTVYQRTPEEQRVARGIIEANLKANEVLQNFINELITEEEFNVGMLIWNNHLHSINSEK